MQKELRPAPGEVVYSGLPDKVPRGATVGENLEEAQELPMTNPARNVHGTWAKGEGSATPAGISIPVVLHLFECLVLQEGRGHGVVAGR